jgi:NAD(P)-dependent dehydrogenase (short-subunit alcohol dehydrogenase family)
VLDVNLTGAFVTCQELGKPARRAGPGRPVILSSSLVRPARRQANAAYSASKFGMSPDAVPGRRAGAHGITANAVCPGQVDTPMLQQLFVDRAASSGRTPDEVRQDLLDTIPLGRLAPPEEIADVYVYLASSLSSYVTAQSLVVDGGCQVGW